jgi:hypothetical protein
MSANNARVSSGAGLAEWDLVLTRTFDAPREVVFRAWTDPKTLRYGGGRKGSAIRFVK